MSVMKSVLFGLTLMTLASCASYEIKEGMPHALLTVTSADLQEKRGADDMTIIRMNKLTGEQRQNIGFFRVPAKESTRSFKIPVEPNMELHTIVNFAYIGSVASCESFMKLNSEEGQSYKLQVSITLSDKGLCNAVLRDDANVVIGTASGSINGSAVSPAVIIY